MLFAILLSVGVRIAYSEVAYPSLLEIVDRHCRSEHHRAPRFNVNDSALISLIDARIQRGKTRYMCLCLRLREPNCRCSRYFASRVSFEIKIILKQACLNHVLMLLFFLTMTSRIGLILKCENIG